MSQIPTLSRPARLDRLCAEAVELARAAAEATGEGVGEYLHAESEADRVVTHFFESTLAGYRGWRWAVVVARAPRSRTVTVNETALLPGPDALNAPEWVPWAERLRAGDVGVGDLLPTDESDTRLMPAYAYSDDDAVEEISYELGVGRTRVMSREGRIDCAERWYDGEHGPNAEIATSAPPEARCGGCGFYLPLAGSLRQLFGVCGNMYATDDATVVSADHGCGAHSEVLTQIDTSGSSLVDLTDTAYDDALIEQIDTSDDEDEDETDASAEADIESDAEAAATDTPQAAAVEPEAVTVDVAQTETVAAEVATVDVAVLDTEAVPAEADQADEDTREPHVATAAVEAASEPTETLAEVTVTVPEDEPVEVAVIEEPQAQAAEVSVGEPVEAASPEVLSPQPVEVTSAAEVSVVEPAEAAPEETLSPQPVEAAPAAEVPVTEPAEATPADSGDVPQPAAEAPTEVEPTETDTPIAEVPAASPAIEDESVSAPESSQVSSAADASDSGREAP